MAPAELGQTDNPKALIPGESELLWEAADRMRAEAEMLENIASGLGAIKIDGWFGAASNLFWDAFGSEQSNWLKAADAMTTGADALDQQGDGVRATQRIAEEAIALWEEGEEATRAAKLAHAAETFAANKHNAEHPNEPPKTVGEFVDPGEPLRQQAREVLNRGREQLEEISARTAAVLDEVRGLGSNAPAWLVAAAKLTAGAGIEHSFEFSNAFEGGSSATYSQSNWNKEFEEKHKFFTEKFGDQKDKPGGSLGEAMNRAMSDGKPSKVNLSVELAKWTAGTEANLLKTGGGFAASNGDLSVLGRHEAKVGGETSASLAVNSDGVKGEAKAFVGGQAGVSGEVRHGDFSAGGSASVKGGAEARASAEIGRDGVKADAGVSAGVTAAANGSANYGIAEVGASGEAFAGAEADVNLSIDGDGVHAGAEAFAGARAEGEVHADVGGVGAGVKGEAWAGIGAEVNVDFGFDENGKFTIGGEAGAALGVGGKVGGEITIDPGKVMETAQSAGQAIADGQAAAAELGKNLAGAFGF